MVDADKTYFEQSTPLARVGRTHELRGAAVWLASDASSFCTGSKQVLSLHESLWIANYGLNLNSVRVDGGVTAW